MVARNIIGTAYVKIRALTGDIEKDIKKALDKNLDNIGKDLGKQIGKQVSDSVEQGMRTVKISTRTLIDDDDVDQTGRKLVDGIQKAVDKIDTKVKVDVEPSHEGIEKTKHAINEIKDDVDDEVEIHPSMALPAAKYVQGRLAWLARTRFVKFVTQIDSKSFATVLAALSGARAIGQGLTNIWDRFKDIDKNILKIGTLASAIVYAGGAVTALFSNLSSLLLGLMQISGIITPMVGLFGGFALGIGTMVAALKDAPIYLRDVGDAFSELQDKISTNFWSRAQEPIRNLVDRLLPALDTGLGNTASALGDFFGAFSDSLGMGLVDDIAEMFDNLVWSIQIAKQSSDDVATSLQILGSHGSEYLPRLAGWWNDINERFANFLTRAEQDGSLERWTETAISNLAAVGDILRGAVRILWEFGEAADEAGGASLQALGDGLNNIADIVSRDPFRTTLVNVLRSAHEMLDDIASQSGPAVEDFFVAFGSTVTNVFQGVGDEIGRVLENLFTALGAQGFQSSLQNMLTGLATGLSKFSDHLPRITEGLGALMDVVATMGNEFLPTLGSAFSAVADVVILLAPTVNLLVTAFSGILGAVSKLPTPVLLLAGAWLLLKSNILAGNAAIKSVRGAVASMTTSFNSAKESVKLFGMYTQTSGIQTAIAATGIAGTTTKLGGFRGAMTLAAGAAKTMGNALKVALISNPIGLIITGITTAISIFAQNAADAKARTDALRGSLDQATGAMTALTDQAIANSFIENNQNMVLAAQELGISLSDLVAAYKGEAPEVIQELTDRQNELGSAFADVNGGIVFTDVSTNKFLNTLRGGEGEIATAVELQQQLAGVTEESADETLSAAEAAQALADKYGEAAEQIDIQINSLEELLRLREEEAGVQRDAVGAYNDLQDSLEGLNEITKTSKDVWNDQLTVFENIRQNPAIGGTVEEMGNLAESAVEAALAMADAGASTDDVQNAMNDAWDSFMAAADALGIDAEQAEQLAISYGLIPKDVVTNIEAGTEGAILSIAGLEAVINSTEGTITIDGETYPADVKLGDFLDSVEDPETGKPVVEIDGNTFDAEMSLAQLIELTGNTELMALIDANNEAAAEKISEVVQAAGNASPVMSIDGDTTLAENSRLDMQQDINNTVGTLGINANDTNAMNTLKTDVNNINNAFGTLDIDGDGYLADKELDAVLRDINTSKGTLDINGDGRLSRTELQIILNKINNSSGTVDVYAADKMDLGKILGRIPKSVTVPVYTVPRGNTGISPRALADGGILRGIETFAGGGVRFGENHRAMLARANGSVRIWAEPETGGEAYIPLAASKRKRSLELWKQVGKIFGALPKNFADGGITAAASFRPGSSSSSTSSTQTVYNTYNVTIDAKDLQGLREVERFASTVRNRARQGQETTY